MGADLGKRPSFLQSSNQRGSNFAGLKVERDYFPLADIMVHLSEGVRDDALSLTGTLSPSPGIQYFSVEN